MPPPVPPTAGRGPRVGSLRVHVASVGAGAASSRLPSCVVSNDAEIRYSDLLPTGEDPTPYRLLTDDGVSTVEIDGRTFLQVDPSVIRMLTAEAMHDIAHYLRPGHLAQLRKIIDDPEASGNDRFVALDLLKNVNISAGGVLPMCQDTGTAIVMGKKSEGVLTEGCTTPTRG
jgi:fumarate hydratase class I